MSKRTLADDIHEISRERGISYEMLRAVLRDFLKALHETDFRSSYFHSKTGGYMTQVYSALGAEATYHLVGFMTRDGKGHDADDVLTELQYLDQRAYRFGTTVERWQAEVDTELADQNEPTGT